MLQTLHNKPVKYALAVRLLCSLAHLSFFCSPLGVLILSILYPPGVGTVIFCICKAPCICLKLFEQPVREVNSTNLDKGKVEVWGLIFFLKRGYNDCIFLICTRKEAICECTILLLQQVGHTAERRNGFLGTDVQKV